MPVNETGPTGPRRGRGEQHGPGGYTRADLAVELRLRDLHPHQVHIVVEGETEEIVCRRVFEELTGMPLNDMGVSTQRLFGSGNMRREMLRAMKAFPRFLVFVADPEGDMAREVEALKRDGVLTDEATYLGMPASRRRTSATRSWLR